MPSVEACDTAVKQKQQSPVEELQCIIQRLETRIATIRERYVETIMPPKNLQPSVSSSQSSSVLRWFGKKSINGTPTSNSKAPSTPEQLQSTLPGSNSNSELQTPSLTPDAVNRVRKERRKLRRDPVADFIPFRIGTETEENPNETIDSFVEDLRRVAEMCIIGENLITRAENKKVEKFRKQQEKWAKARGDLVEMMDVNDATSTSGGDDSERDMDITLSTEKMQLFELFFENNGLGMIVDLLTGRTFQLMASEKAQIVGTTDIDERVARTSQSQSTNASAAASTIESKLSLDKSSSHSSSLMFWSSSKGTDKTKTPAETKDKNDTERVDESTPAPAEKEISAPTTGDDKKDDKDGKIDTDSPDHPWNKTMLPPLRVAIQALQSISILIQNVTRATSLYVILSNNHINALTALPTTMYEIAERRRQENAKEISILPSYTAESSNTSISELASHFVTFLKSLAMRINAETVQFFLTYPSDPEHNVIVRKMLLSSQQFHSPGKAIKKTVRNLRRTKSNDPRSLGTLKNKNQRSSSADLGTDMAVTAVAASKKGSLSKSSSTSPANSVGPSDDQSPNTTIDREQSIGIEDFDQLLSHKSSSKLATNSSKVSDGGSYCQDLQSVSDLKFVSVQFPLYERALEFCSLSQDSMVRLTAMNICLNTLRLVTVDDDGNKNCNSTSDRASAVTPDGVLHNKDALPFPERIAIAQYACTPSRVERLIAPIFAKMAERWNAIEEQIRQIDSNKHMGIERRNALDSLDDDGKTDEAVRQQRLLQSFKDKVDNLKDDLYMLEDVFKVGMTVLNEQCIEMMLATFVYPLLVQPLLTYMKEYKDAVDDDRLSFSHHPFGGIGADLSDVDKALLPVACPAKAAMFATATVFQTITNKPLLRLLFTLLLHTLSPDSAKAPTVRSKLQVATVSNSGRNVIRVDQENEINASDRTTYAFGSLQKLDTLGRCNIDLSNENDDDDNKEACIFVLAPALAEVIESNSVDTSLLSRCRPNPYRRAILNFLELPDAMSDIRELATCTIDAALSIFEGTFASDILFGTDAEVDDTAMANDDGTDSEKYVNEVVLALVCCTVFATKVGSNDWKLGYDEVGAQALLHAIRRNPRAIGVAAKALRDRLEKAAGLFSERPSDGLIPMGSGNLEIPGSPTVNDPDFEDRMFDMFVDHVFFDSLDLAGVPLAESQLLQLKIVPTGVHTKGFCTQVSKDGSSEALTSRIGIFFRKTLQNGVIPRPDPFDKNITRDRRDGVIAFVRLDALSTLCQSLSSTNGYAIHDSPLTFASNDTSSNSMQANRCTISPISKELSQILFTVGNGTDPLPTPTSSIDLSTCDLLPCVCEAPGSAAYLFTDDNTGIVSEGVTWQSLYIVFADEYVVLAQPIPGESGGRGRVISSCGLAQLIVQTDPGPVQQGGPARRLLFSHKWFDSTPPPLFLYDTTPEQPKDSLPFVHVSTYVSRLDVWFEHQRAADLAFKSINKRIFEAKAKRGVRLQSFITSSC